MPLFIGSLIGGLAMAASSLVGRVLLALGMSYVAYSGIDLAVSALLAEVKSQVNSLPAVALAIVSATKLDVAISIIFSAISARLVVMGLTSGVVKKLVIK